ncbi:hypothetical protein NPIL_430961 [Nephila pilipes]|uniref:Uncharacterized protein n=1 Tax=Nephila pilipes TaxID=299642 RepID=A0A8X6UMW7_NEPPI|nr:hypothetical protein NPIL_430961 [Nephila pilipes]
MKKHTPLVNKVNRDLADASALVSLDSGPDNIKDVMMVELNVLVGNPESLYGWCLIGNVPDFASKSPLKNGVMNLKTFNSVDSAFMTYGLE